MSIANIINKSTQLIDTKYIPPLGYGQFSRNSDMVVSGANVATAVGYDTTEIAQFCAFSGSTIEILKAGVWKFAYSVQLDKTGGGTEYVDIWIKINGSNVPRSSSRTTVQGNNGENFVMCEYILDFNLNDKIQVYFTSPDDTMKLAYFAGTGSVPNEVPAVPSIISTLVQLT
jgi:hypothetical protein